MTSGETNDTQPSVEQTVNAARPEAAGQSRADVESVAVALEERRAAARDVMTFYYEYPHTAIVAFGGRRQTGDGRSNDDRVEMLELSHNLSDALGHFGSEWNG